MVILESRSPILRNCTKLYLRRVKRCVHRRVLGEKVTQTLARKYRRVARTKVLADEGIKFSTVIEFTYPNHQASPNP